MEISAITFFPRHTRITVRFRHHLYTSQLPNFDTALLQMLPTLRGHLCENRSGLPFTEEIKHTELGHAFEHVMLAILRERGLYLRGQTTWNWQRDPLGTYHVTINTGKKLLVKEGLLVAQTVFTNAMVGPVLSVEIPPCRRRRDELAVRVRSGRSPGGGRRLVTRALFASGATQNPRDGVGDA